MMTPQTKADDDTQKLLERLDKHAKRCGPANAACADAAREIRRLQQIVSALPKTADGVPITFGMRVWYWDEEAELTPDVPDTFCSGNFLETIVTAIYTKQFSDYVGDVTIGVSGDWEGGNGDVWSTRAAAMAGAKEAT